MENAHGKWVPCDSRAELLSKLHADALDFLITDNPSCWGHLDFCGYRIVPVGFSGMGLVPVGARFKDRIFVGIDEVLVGYDWRTKALLFRYKMPTVFHEFIRFDCDGLIVRDEIGFVGVSYNGAERWIFCVGVIANYEIRDSTIVGTTDEGESFEFTIPSAGENK